MKLFAKRAATVVTMLALTVGLGFCLVACSSASNDESMIKKELDEVLSAFKNPTAESLAPYMGDSADMAQLNQYGIDYVELFQHLFKHFDYSIDSVTVNGNDATAKITVKNADISKAVADATSSLQNDTEFVNSLMAAYSSGGETAMYKLIFDKVYAAIDSASDVVTSQADLKLTKKDGKWNVEDSSLTDFVSKVYGGIDLSSL